MSLQADSRKRLQAAPMTVLLIAIECVLLLAMCNWDFLFALPILIFAAGFLFSSSPRQAFVLQFLVVGIFFVALTLLADWLKSDFLTSARLGNMIVSALKVVVAQEPGGTYHGGSLGQLSAYFLVFILNGLPSGFAGASGAYFRRYLLRPVSISKFKRHSSMNS